MSLRCATVDATRVGRRPCLHINAVLLAGIRNTDIRTDPDPYECPLCAVLDRGITPTDQEHTLRYGCRYGSMPDQEEIDGFETPGLLPDDGFELVKA